MCVLLVQGMALCCPGGTTITWALEAHLHCAAQGCCDACSREDTQMRAHTHTHACAHIKHAHVHSNTRGSGIKAREDLNPVLRARCPSWGGPICLTTRLSVNPKV